MRTLLVLAALGWMMSQPWTALIGLVLIVAALMLFWFLAVSIERRAASPRRGGNTTDHHYVAALETMVAEAEAEVETLRGEIKRLRSAGPASEPDPMTALYHKVGLVPGAPGWLITAARKAYRSALHPDRHPAHRKQEAQRRFQQAESVFNEIAASVISSAGTTS
ncbi:MAG: hypothetical protein ABS35_20965 [Kaistia sp. SCN 65-12]|jgi:hypothetical protein|nr:MAG: hypothetical protein ABS35_20965 [Kaistia sp. SCN 65-12]